MATVLSRRPGGGGGDPSGPAGGSLSGTYPNPTIADDAVDTAQIADDAVEQAQIADGAVGTSQLASGIGLIQIFDSTLGGNAQIIDSGAGSIPATFDHLLLVMLLRTDEAAGLSAALLRFNADTGANYDFQQMHVTNTTVAGTINNAQTSVNITVCGNSAAATHFAAVEAWIPCYAQTVARKSGSLVSAAIDTTAANCRTQNAGFVWRNTAAITRISVERAAGNLIAGSRMTIYGAST